MKKYRGLFLLFVFAISAAASAAPNNDLERAVSRGDASALASALKAGADVNARFDIRRTPLMNAAIRGDVPTMEALLNAGADMYARDNNGEDALMHAVAYEQTAAVRFLLSRGFDPSLNDWRALKIIPPTDSQTKGVSTLGPKHPEIRKILLAYKEKGMPTPSQAPMAATRGASTASIVSTPTARITDEAAPVVIDTSGQKITPEIFKNAASRALLRRGWQIAGIENNRLVGTLTKDTTYKAAVVFLPPMIVISYEPGYGSPKQNWLLNIRKDLLWELNAILINK